MTKPSRSKARMTSSSMTGVLTALLMDFPHFELRVSLGGGRNRFPARHQSDDLAGVPVGQRRERRQWQRLVPVGDGGDVVLQLEIARTAAPSERLHGYAKVGPEPDWVREVPPVQPEALLRPVGAVGAQDLRHARIGRGEFHVLAVDVEVVGAAEVVL